ncbi:protein of unknown function [Candidatus Bipolaricaulis anaerobius]|uniref:HTH-like domain-containing protein n=1 Tax=Candidatus Bipolaricaulis anaerobius TaxID=2026885 RepID=A0A2X3K4Z0_9BACT|nr:protein of unknown function [Candidatus Bipolaricaulis anaerobius]
MSAHQVRYPVATMCRVLEVSTSGYYAWMGRFPSRQAREDVRLRERIEAIHARSRGTYGAPRIHAKLRAQGIRVGRKRVARLMREAGGHQPASAPGDDEEGSGGAAGPGPGEAGVHQRGAGPAVGRGHRVHPDRGRDPVPSGGGGCVQPAGGGVGDGGASADGTRAQGPEHGDRATPAAGSDPSLRPREPVHGRCVREEVPGGRDPAVDGIRGRLPRQRAL